MTCYMWIDGLTSGSASAPGPEWIAVDGYSFALGRDTIVAASSGDGDAPSKPLIKLASVEKSADRHTAALARWHVDHRERRAKKVVIADCELGFEPQTVLTLENALLVGYGLSGASHDGGGDTTERLTLEATRIEFQYRALDASSRPQPARSFRHDDARA